MLCGYKLIGDNIDKNVKPRDMRADHQTMSLHYFNVYAVQDRFDLGHLSNESRILDHGDVDLSNLLPTAKDYDALSNNLSVLISRVLVNNFAQLSEYAMVVTKHINHKYSQMSTKSNIVSCKMDYVC